MLLETSLIWDSVILSFQCEINAGYQKSLECWGDFDREKNNVKMDDF